MLGCSPEKRVAPYRSKAERNYTYEGATLLILYHFPLVLNRVIRYVYFYRISFAFPNLCSGREENTSEYNIDLVTCSSRC